MDTKYWLVWTRPDSLLVMGWCHVADRVLLDDDYVTIVHDKRAAYRIPLEMVARIKRVRRRV